MATRFHTPVFMDDLHIHELLDPQFPQDAATKAYADQASNEVVIQRDEPRDVRAELWVDYDEAGSTALEQEVYVTLLEPAPPWELWADLSGVTPPGGGVNVPVEEVTVGPTAPTAVTAELWMDTAAPDPLSQSAIITALQDEVARLRADINVLMGR